jgi:hypothetical protein
MEQQNQQQSTTQISQKSVDQVATVKTIFGTIILILSGCILYLDKVFNYFNIGQDMDFGYYESLEAFIWHISQTISPLLILLAFQFNPKKWALISPLSIYSIQVMYILRDEQYIEAQYFWLYTWGFVLCCIICYQLTFRLIITYALYVGKLKQSIRDLRFYVLKQTRTNTIVLEDQDDEIKSLLDSVAEQKINELHLN